MNLRDLRYLVALADHQHFGRAAAACFVSQPTLSTQIRKLEDELGVALVERAPRKVMLTPAGREIAERARRIVSDVEQMKEAARRSQDPEAGTVRLGIFPTLGPYLLPHVVPQIRARFPRLELLLVEEKSDVLLARLREGRLDAGLLALPVHDEQLHAEFLFEEPFLLAVPEQHPLATRSSLTLKDLADQRLLLLEDGHCLRDQALDVCQLAGAGEKSGFQATSLETLRQMVAANVGVTLLPTLAVKPPVARSDNIRLLALRRRAAEPADRDGLAQEFGDGGFPAAAGGGVPAVAPDAVRTRRQAARSRRRGRVVSLRTLAVLGALCALGWWYSPLSPRVPGAARAGVGHRGGMPATAARRRWCRAAAERGAARARPVPRCGRRRCSRSPASASRRGCCRARTMASAARPISRRPISRSAGGACARTRCCRGSTSAQSSRWYNYRWQGEPPLPPDEIARSSANMHMIPSDAATAAALRRVRAGDEVRIDGWLVEVAADDGWRWRSSLSRDDKGSGACEVVYVCAITAR